MEPLGVSAQHVLARRHGSGQTARGLGGAAQRGTARAVCTAHLHAGSPAGVANEGEHQAGKENTVRMSDS